MDQRNVNELGEDISSKKYIGFNVGGLNPYALIKFLAEDFEIISETDFTIKINRISSFNDRIQTLIGEPVPYKDYTKKKVILPLYRIT